LQGRNQAAAGIVNDLRQRTVRRRRP
jgi:hypothetical protein